MLVIPIAVALSSATSGPTAVPLLGLRDQEPSLEPTSIRQAADAFEEGEAAYARKDFDRAVDAFERAQRLAPHPDTEFNLALALARADRELDAWRILERLEASAPRAAQRRDARIQRGVLRTRLASVRVVTGTEASICIDGMQQQPGTEWILRPGSYDVDVGTFEQRFELQPGEAKVVDLRFTDEPRPAPTPTPRAVAPLLGIATVSAAAATVASVVAAVENREHVARGWSYAAAGVSAVAVGTVVAGLTLHLRARRHRSSPTPSPPAPVSSCPPPTNDAVVVRTAP